MSDDSERETTDCYWSPIGKAYVSDALPGACSCEPATGLPSDQHALYVKLYRLRVGMIAAEARGDLDVGEWADELADAMDMLLPTTPGAEDSEQGGAR